MKKRLAILAILLFSLTADFARAETSSGPQDSVLYQIIHDCLDPTVSGYCYGACPAPLVGACSQAASCRKTTKLFAQSPHFAAIRDRKTCGCPEGFVHALAIPKSPVSGIEDPNRPSGVWAFAWKSAKAIFPSEPKDAIALAINPPGKRSQSQMHVHIVLLDEDARSRLADYEPQPVEDLKDVWSAAQRSAKLSGIQGWYGVLVAHRRSAPGFWVAADAKSPEKDFTQYSCHLGSFTP